MLQLALVAPRPQRTFAVSMHTQTRLRFVISHPNSNFKTTKKKTFGISIENKVECFWW
jgi:hypothetical protein